MHSIKGSWVGQTFALAKCNDSGGKKSRIRRSKEERKSLVESFIKQHQKLNNGSFPSLNLTHKEVGGSFYTVREIVREVIQENRVLGPGNPNDIFQHHLIGSFCNENESDLISTNCSSLVTHILPHDQDMSEKLVPSDNVEGLETPSHNYILGDELYLNGSSESFQKNQEHEREMVLISEGKENLVLDEGVEDIEGFRAEVPNLEAALLIDKSPLTSGHGLDDKINALNGKSAENEGHTVLDGTNFLENVSGLVDENLVSKVEVPVGEYLDNYLAKEGIDSEEPVLNANTQGLELESQSLGEKLQFSGLKKVSGKNEEEEDVCIGSGDREISKLEEISNNGNILNEILGKGRIPELEGKSSNESFLNENLIRREIPEPEEKSSNGSVVLNESLGKGEILEQKEKSIYGSILNENSEKGEISELEEISSNGIVLNENLEKEKIPELEEKSSNRSVLNENVEKAEFFKLEAKSNNGSVLSENLEKGEISELEEKSSNGTVLNGNLEKEEISELKENSSNGSVLDENVEKREIRVLEENCSDGSFIRDESNFKKSASELNDARKIANSAVKQLENCCHLVIEKPALEEISKDSMVTEGTVLDTEDKDASVVGVKMSVFTNGTNTQSSRNAKTSSSEQTIPEMAKTTQNNPNIQLVDDLKVANSTLDRINLESWKRTSDEHQKMPTNPLLAYFKAFVTAFVKFWSE